ncbi:GNAT family N-acetyltransferase [Kitasatospora sp. LaBMicrA B282]|uniref:GNAT family N-acetyltransferase n=1 Tax=Kitasatospora sp. LaBMicrA B282 TaxID=3420949 RepID=UPI003D0C402D
MTTQPAVTLHRIEPADWTAVHSWAARPEVCRHQPWGPNTEEQSRQFVEQAVAAWAADPQERYAFLARLGPVPVGMGELLVRSRRARQGEIAYLVHPDHWGAGIATAIGRLLLAHGFDRLGLHRVFGTCDPRNVGSARVLRKLGLVHEGRLRDADLLRDGWRDTEVFGILEEEWRRGRCGGRPQGRAGMSEARGTVESRRE